jgi:hypothetical protein
MTFFASAFIICATDDDAPASSFHSLESGI